MSTFYYTDRAFVNSTAVDVVYFNSQTQTVGVRYNSGPTVYAWPGTEQEFYDIVDSYSVGSAVKDFKFGRGQSVAFDNVDVYHPGKADSISLKDTLSSLSESEVATNSIKATDVSQGTIVGQPVTAGSSGTGCIVTVVVRDVRFELEVDSVDITDAVDDAYMALADEAEVVSVVRK